jgi:hypothetical protein
MSGGLSPNELRALREEHGSYESAIEARPDLADFPGRPKRPALSEWRTGLRLLGKMLGETTRRLGGR